jgi:2-polyprenyl-3-methyl-5-hydroxy-6-metoxy-1,4-benzoquinol methylase
MPSSRPLFLEYFCDVLIANKPESILDIGCGHGKFGFLAREYTDVWNGNYWNKKTRIDAIEIFSKYIGDLQKAIYNNIYTDDVLKVLPGLDKYEMIICADVLEHMDTDKGIILLDAINLKSEFAMVTTPVKVSKQKEVYGNKDETHRSQWSKEKLSNWGKVYKARNTYLLEIRGDG